MSHRKLPTDENNPKKICYWVLAVVENYSVSVWHGGDGGKLEALHAKGYANYGDTKKNAKHGPCQKEPKSSKNKPDNI